MSSSGTFELNGRAEILLGQFERRYLSEVEANGQNGFDFGQIFGGSPKKNVSNKQQVATKFAPYPWRITRGSLVQAARESLKRLEQEKLCVAQLHWSTSNYQPFQEGEIVLY
jgi:pyridoxine 4-dehydrogenase